jgi:hypothetical protein
MNTDLRNIGSSIGAAIMTAVITALARMPARLPQGAQPLGRDRGDYPPDSRDDATSPNRSGCSRSTLRSARQSPPSAMATIRSGTTPAGIVGRRGGRRPPSPLPPTAQPSTQSVCELGQGGTARVTGDGEEPEREPRKPWGPAVPG